MPKSSAAENQRPDTPEEAISIKEDEPKAQPPEESEPRRVIHEAGSAQNIDILKLHSNSHSSESVQDYIDLNRKRLDKSMHKSSSYQVEEPERISPEAKSGKSITF